MLGLHAACAGILLFDAWLPEVRGLKRIAAMQAFLFVAVIKYSPPRMKEHMDSFALLAPGMEPPPEELFPLLGYAEVRV